MTNNDTVINLNIFCITIIISNNLSINSDVYDIIFLIFQYQYSLFNMDFPYLTDVAITYFSIVD
jgi:hypothetical protein